MLPLRSLAVKAALVLTACGTDSPAGPTPNPEPVVPAVASLTLSATEVTIQRGTTIQLVATPRDRAGNPLTGRAVTWHSATPEVVTITNGDRLTAVGHGTAFITATVEGKSAQVTVRVPEVTPAVAALVVAEPNLLVAVGMAKFADVAPVDSEGRLIPNVGISWESLDEQIASVTPGGAVMTHRAGTTTIIARAGQLEAAINVTVTPFPGSTPVATYPLAAIDGGQLGATIWAQVLQEGPHYTTWRLKRLMGGQFVWDVTTQRYVLTLRIRTATATTWHNGTSTIEGEIVEEVVMDEGTVSHEWPGTGLRLASTVTPGMELTVAQMEGAHLRVVMGVPGSFTPRTLEFRRP